MKSLLSILPILIAILLSGCASSSLPIPPKLTYEQDGLIEHVQHSLRTRQWTFNSLLAKAGQPPYLQRRTGKPFLRLNGVTNAKSIAPGVSVGELGNPNVREYAFFKGGMTSPDRQTSLWCWRVFVRNGRIIYMEFAPVSEKTFWSYFEVVN